MHIQTQIEEGLIASCRSAFTEEFKDAKGFGWTVDERPPFNWKELIAKKVHILCLCLPDC